MKKKGFTLIELLATLAIFSLLITAIISIFSINIKASKNIFKDALDYKEENVAMMYIDNIVKSSYKIELMEDTGQTNFKSYVLDKKSNEISSVYFKTEKSSDGNKYLMAVRDNISNKSKRDGTIRISKIDDLYLYYDNESKIVEIILNQGSQQCKIYLGERLWKKALYPSLLY